jgi:hypothetical protein
MIFNEILKLKQLSKIKFKYFIFGTLSCIMKKCSDSLNRCGAYLSMLKRKVLEEVNQDIFIK